MDPPPRRVANAARRSVRRWRFQRVLQLFHPQELMALVVGNENYDWDVWSTPGTKNPAEASRV